MDKDLVSVDFVNHAIWFEMEFQEMFHIHTGKLGRHMSPVGQIIQAVAEIFQVTQDVLCALPGVVFQDVGIYLKDVILGIFYKMDLMGHWISLMRVRMLLKDFLAVVKSPCCLLLVLWANILSRARLSFIFS